MRDQDLTTHPIRTASRPFLMSCLSEQVSQIDSRIDGTHPTSAKMRPLVDAGNLSLRQAP
jgi:hypothetical protein